MRHLCPIISSTKKGNIKKDYEKEDYNKRTTARSGSRSGIVHTDPDPAKSYGSGRIRIRNTGHRYTGTVFY